VPVKVLDIDRDRQRISLGLKQTQEDPWQRVVDSYQLGDELEGKVTKVVSFGAFVEILDGVEGLVHISELAQHHVENPREIVDPGDVVKVKILEIDDERRRLSLSLKRVEGQVLPMREIAPSEGSEGADGDGEVGDVPDLDLSEEVFSGDEAGAEPQAEEAVAEQPAAPVEEPEAPEEEPADAAEAPEAAAEEPAAPAVDEPEPAAEQPEASAAEPEPPAEQAEPT
jgi:small subunit ribosomal protein S1